MKYLDCVLRPIEQADLELVLKWRNSERIRETMFSNHVITWDEHVRWFEKIKSGAINSKVFIFEIKFRPVGLVNVNCIDLANKRCSWGFYLGEEGVPLGSGTAMGILALEYIFDVMGFNKLCAKVLTSNFISQKYHLKLGFEQEGYFRSHIYRKGNYEDIICYGHFKNKWDAIKDQLVKNCFTEE